MTELYLFLNPHPDDVEISSSGTVFQKIQENRTHIIIAYITSGDLLSENRIENSKKAWGKVLRKESLEEKKISFVELGYPELTVAKNMREIVDELFESIRKEVSSTKMITIFSPTSISSHIDHAQTGYLSKILQIVIENKLDIKSSLIYYTDAYMSTDTIKNNFEIITNELNEKIKCYKEELIRGISEQTNASPEKILQNNSNFTKKLSNINKPVEIFLYE